MTPFEWFTTNPLVPGVSGQAQYLVSGALHQGKYTFDASAMFAGVVGDPTNATYWGEPFLGTFDPLEGRSNLQVPIVYPTHQGYNDVLAGGLSFPYSIDMHANDDRWRVTGGYLQTSSYDQFLFTQPPTSTFVPSITQQTFETLGPGLADISSWLHLASALPVLGADATAQVGAVSVEGTDALLPDPENTSVRMTGGNVVWDKGDRGRFSAGIVHVQSTGDPQAVPTLFGANPRTYNGAQGPVASSTLADQTQTLVGARAFFRPHKGYDALIELGRAWYNAGLVARPGTEAPGNFQHYQVTRHFNKDDYFGLEYYRMDPRYASMVLPYGIPLNVWGIAWAYPGPWLKGTYQLVNNTWGGENREGLRAFGRVKRGRWSGNLAAYDYRQIEPSTAENMTSTGFVEVDYLILQPNDLQYGRTKGLDAYVSWADDKDTVSLDYGSDSEFRGHALTAPVDGVSMHYPQIVIAERHRFDPTIVGVLGYARYQATGTWTTTPVYGVNALGFAGVQFDLGRYGQILIRFTAYGTKGDPSIPGGPPPTLHGTGLIVDHHFNF